ncbi:hypothetical protein FRC11_006401 [Ceratobasidium sp. 423]|nr:hypothetical protein FRC11_006401 [Ceratobasidium sp. 423]
MTKEELEAWYRWITAGQDGRLRDDQVFQFSLVQRGKNLEVLRYSGLQKSQPKDSQLKWAASEKQYAYKVQKAAEDKLSKTEWLGLPLARLYCVYEPFDERTRELITAGLPPDYKAKTLVDLISRMEGLGPIHTTDPQCTETLSAYMNAELAEAQIKALIFGQAFYVHSMGEDNRTLPTCFIGHLALIYRDYPSKLSTDCVKALDACNFQRLQASLLSFADWFVSSLESTVTRLRVTFRERAHAWKEAVVNSGLTDPDDNIGHESVSLDTHGIPRGRGILRACYEQLQEQDPDITIGQDNNEFLQANRRAKRRATAMFDGDEDELSDRDSLSAESIELPPDDTDEDNTGEDDTDEDFREDSLAGPTAAIPSGWDGRRNYADDALPTYDTLDSAVGPDVNESLIGVLADRNVSKEISIVEHPTEEPMGGRMTHMSEAEPEPSWASGTTFPASDDEAEPLPACVLQNVSPLRLRAAEAPQKSSRKLRMEVVIPTPRKQVISTPQGSTGRSDSTPRKHKGTEDPETPDAEDIPLEPLAVRRPKRSIGRSEQVEEAIRAASKGSYQPK